VLLYATAGVWVLLVGAVAVRGVVAGILILLTGIVYHGQHVPSSQGAEFVFFSLATLLLIFRFVKTRPTILDRVALTFSVVVLVWHWQTPASDSIELRLTAGLIALGISWCVYHWKATKPRSRQPQLSG